MAGTQEIKMTTDHVVLGERWKAGRKYDAAPREVQILVEDLKVAKLVNEFETKGE